MSIREVVKMGDARLLQIAEPVKKFATPGLQALIDDMLDTMRARNGVGLAAPQIGINRRIVIFGFEDSSRYPKELAVPKTILINPKIEALDETMEDGWEGCLSIPGMRGLVPRYTHIRYTGFDEKGNPIERIAQDFHARVVQHECDHLDGVLYPMRIKDLRYFGFEETMLVE